MKRFIHGGRITSLHGVQLPPKKKQVFDKYITARFVIEGTIPSKKNMIWAANNLGLIINKLWTCTSVKECIECLKINLRSFIRNSKKYTEWVDDKRPTLLDQMKKESKRYRDHGLIWPLSNVSIKVYHYWADNLERDNSNKYDSIIDLFVSCGIITNDCWQVVHRNESESECYHGEIRSHITTIDITERMTKEKAPVEVLEPEVFELEDAT